jgi:hypothetical protein
MNSQTLLALSASVCMAAQLRPRSAGPSEGERK